MNGVRSGRAFLKDWKPISLNGSIVIGQRQEIVLGGFDKFQSTSADVAQVFSLFLSLSRSLSPAFIFLYVSYSFLSLSFASLFLVFCFFLSLFSLSTRSSLLLSMLLNCFLFSFLHPLVLSSSFVFILLSRFFFFFLFFHLSLSISLSLLFFFSLSLVFLFF